MENLVAEPPKRVVKIHNGVVAAPQVEAQTASVPAQPDQTTSAAQEPPASNISDQTIEQQPEATENKPVTSASVTTPADAMDSAAEPDINSILKEKTGGRFNSIEEITALLDRSAQPESPQFKDDFIKGVVDYYNNTGDLTTYLQAKLMDWDKVSEQDLIKMELREKNPEYSDKGLDYLLKKELDKYNNEDLDDEEREFLQEDLKVRAERIRAKMKEQQAKFVAPTPTNPQNVEEKINEFKQSVLNNENVKRVLNDKRVVIQYPDGDFNFEIANPVELSEMLFDNNKWLSKIAAINEVNGKKTLSITPNGMKVMAYASNPEQYEKSLIDYGKSLGKQAIEAEIKNISVPQYGRPVEGEPNDQKTKVKVGLAKALDKLIQVQKS